jgi:Ca2+-binding RTX toxin-like protein
MIMAIIYGDMAGTLEGKAKSQTLIGIDNEINEIYGDADYMSDRRGGNDVLTGGASADINVLIGDASDMSDSQGGNDVLTGGASAGTNLLIGDAQTMSDSQGGNDVLTGGASSGVNALYGDAATMVNSQGGNDVLTGGAGSSVNGIFGDASYMSDSQGGNDVVTGGAGSSINYLYGDAEIMSDSQGGNDVLIGGSSSISYLYGDAQGMSDSRGGNDTLIASDNPSTDGVEKTNLLYGDAEYYLAGSVVCGNDRLISGMGNDVMWGDIAYSGFDESPLDLTLVTTGQDVFVFSANNGNDKIYDFRQGEDKIELQGIGVASFDELMGAHLEQDDMNTVITFGSNTITVIGVTDMTAADFLFV